MTNSGSDVMKSMRLAVCGDTRQRMSRRQKMKTGGRKKKKGGRSRETL